MRIPSILIAALCLSSAAGCGHKMAVVRPNPLLLDQRQAPDAVRAAIIRALGGQRMITESEQPGRIVARFDRRGMMLRLGIEYSESQCTVRYLEPALVPGPSGEFLVDARTARVVQHLERSIVGEIGRPAREAAAAEAAARRHELSVEAERRRRAEADAEAERLRNQPPPPPQPDYPTPDYPTPAPMPAPPPPPSGGGHHHKVQHRTVIQSLACCVNGAYYNCPSNEALSACVALRPSACVRDQKQDRNRCRR